jgi:hypothetical protein
MLSTALTAGLVLVLGQLPWVLELRTEGRGFAGAGDLALDPQLTLGYESRDVLIHARYSPHLLLQAPSSRGTFEEVQAGSISAALRLDRDTVVHALQDFSLGSVSLSWLASAPDTPPPSIVRDADGAALEMLNESSSVTLDHAISRWIRVTGTAGYSIAGGAGSDLVTVPRTRTGGLHASGSWLERSDAFSVGVAGSRSWVSTGETTWLLGASAAWRHAFTPASERALGGEQSLRLGEREDPRYETELSAGAAATEGRALDGYRIVPTASLALRRDEPAPRVGAVGARLLLRYSPSLDLATGELTPRYELSTMGEVRLHRQVVAFAGSGVAMTRDPTPPAPEVLAQGGIGLTYEPVAGVTISASGRVAKLSAVEWGAVLTTTFTERGRF